jgi:hypothetical protein
MMHRSSVIRLIQLVFIKKKRKRVITNDRIMNVKIIFCLFRSDF